MTKYWPCDHVKNIGTQWYYKGVHGDSQIYLTEEALFCHRCGAKRPEEKKCVCDTRLKGEGYILEVATIKGTLCCADCEKPIDLRPHFKEEKKECDHLKQAMEGTAKIINKDRVMCLRCGEPFFGPYAEEKKKKLLAPAIIKDREAHSEFKSERLFQSQSEAIEAINKEGCFYFVHWPAIPNKNGFYEVPE